MVAFIHLSLTEDFFDCYAWFSHLYVVEMSNTTFKGQRIPTICPLVLAGSEPFPCRSLRGAWSSALSHCGRPVRAMHYRIPQASPQHNEFKILTVIKINWNEFLKYLHVCSLMSEGPFSHKNCYDFLRRHGSVLWSLLTNLINSVSKNDSACKWFTYINELTKWLWRLGEQR